MHRLNLGTLLICLGFLVGCTSKPNIPVRDWGGLAEASKTTYEPLQKALSRVVAEQGTPAQITEQITQDLKGQTNFILQIQKIFNQQGDLPLLRLETKLFTEDKAHFSPVVLAELNALRQRYASELKQLDLLLKSPPHLGLSPANAYVNDYAFLDQFRAAQVLVISEIGASLQSSQLEATSSHFAKLWQLSRILEEHGVSTPRLQAAQLRLKTFWVMRAVLEHPAVSRNLQREYAKHIGELLQNWQGEQALLRNERTMGLAVYEQIRQGGLLSLLPLEDYLQLKQEKRLEITRRTVRENLDKDQTFYLEIMNTLLDAKPYPFAQRKHELHVLRTKLIELADTPDYSYVADRFLLNDVEKILQITAEDYARCQAWFIALNEETPSTQSCLDPITGHQFRREIIGNRVVVRRETATKEMEDISLPIRSTAFVTESQPGY